jgi:hypothetical protein
MDRMRDESSHSRAIDAWLERSTDRRSSVEIAAVFRVAFERLWNRAVTTLGSVTLTAIADRVLYTATARYPFLSAINPRPNGDARWKQQLHDRLVRVPSSELLEGLRFAMIELLTIIGRLTAEILTPELHAALLEIEIEVTARAPDAAALADPPALPAAVDAKEQS